MVDPLLVGAFPGVPPISPFPGRDRKAGRAARDAPKLEAWGRARFKVQPLPIWDPLPKALAQGTCAFSQYQRGVPSLYKPRMSELRCFRKPHHGKDVNLLLTSGGR